MLRSFEIVKKIGTRLSDSSFLLKMPPNIRKVKQRGYTPKQMFSKERTLPSLPVPPLQQTTEKYLLSLQPLLDENAFNCSQQVVNEFRKPGGIGEQLQEKLVAKAKSSDNWLAEWWDNVGYFEYRDPVVINVSPAITFPKQEFRGRQDQLKYSARLINSVLFMHDMIDSESVPVDMMGKNPLTMVQYGKLLNCCRIPHTTRDRSVKAPRGSSQHVIVAHNNQFFKLVVEDNGDRLTEHQLVQQLQRIVNASQERDDNSVGILTSQNRSAWAKGYKKLMNDVTNRVILNEITTSLCLLCLDTSPAVTQVTPAPYENVDMSLSSQNIMHGGGSMLNSGNRWFDKTVQFIVSEDGYAGCCYEHSAAEGPPVVMICNKIIEDSQLSFVWDDDSLQTSDGLNTPEKLQWKINDAIAQQICEAKEAHDSAVTDLELKAFQFRSFGKNIPKTYRFSPDAFIQVALQLAYYRIHNHIAPTYESAGTRMFKLGRTETIRSGTASALKFCKAMTNANATAVNRRDLLTKAIQAHVKYTKEAMAGQGVDRHLLGLKLIALEAKLPLPDLYRDHGYTYSAGFKLSTSQIASPYDTVTAFGPAAPDCYGVCYNPMEQQINFAITTFNSHPETQAGRMAESLARSLDDMHGLLLSVAKL